VANLALFFVSPQRVPPVRWLMAGSGFGWRRSHASDGMTYDGVLLQADLPDQVRDALVEAGAERVDRASTWWPRHRVVVSDPVVKERTIRLGCLQSALQLAAWFAFAIAFGALYFTDEEMGAADIALIAVPAVIGGALFLAALLVRRSSRSIVRKGSRSH